MAFHDTRARSRRVACITIAAALVGSTGLGGCANDPAAGPPTPTATPDGESSAPGGSVRSAPFPKPEALEELREAPTPEELFAAQSPDVDTWELTGPFPDRIEAAHFLADDPWNAVLGEAVAQRPGLVVPTEAMHCVARELGKFYLTFDAPPPLGLQRFMMARCNASVVSIRSQFLKASLGPEVADETVFEQWREKLGQAVAAHLTGGSQAIGVWFGRSGEWAVAAVVSGPRQLLVEPIGTQPGADGRVVIRGEALRSVVAVQAVIGRGRLGYELCTAREGIALPRFEFECSADPSDPMAWIEVSYQEPGRIIATPGLQVLVFPSGKPSDVYQRPSYAEEIAGVDVPSARAGLAELLNQVREKAGLSRFEVEAEQSEVATELAPHFFAAALGESESVEQDLVVLGLIAGWSVQGIVQDGNFAAAYVTGTNDLGRLLSAALERPSNRVTLLSPDLDRIAIGPVLEVTGDVPSLAAIFGAYTLFSEEAHDDSARRVYDLLEEQRAAHGVGPPRLLTDAAGPAMAAAGQIEAGADASDTLGELVELSAQLLRRSVHGSMVETSDLDDIQFPEAYLTDRNLEIAVGVSHRKPPGEAWGRYVVLFVTAEPAGQQL